MRYTLSVLMVVMLGLGVMGCNKAELEAKDKEIAGLKEKVTMMETENADLKAKVASLEEQLAATKVEAEKSQKAAKTRRRK